jgi:hypothetical protein
LNVKIWPFFLILIANNPAANSVDGGSSVKQYAEGAVRFGGKRKLFSAEGKERLLFNAVREDAGRRSREGCLLMLSKRAADRK